MAGSLIFLLELWLLTLLGPGLASCDVGAAEEPLGSSACYDEAVWLQVPKSGTVAENKSRWAPSFLRLPQSKGYADWILKLGHQGARGAVSLLQVRDQQVLQVFVMSLVGLMSLACFFMVVFIVNTVLHHTDGSREFRPDSPHARIAAAANTGAMPVFCPPHMGHHHEPLRAELSPIEAQGNWVLDIQHPNSKKVVFRAKMWRGGQNVEGVLARRRSFIQVFSHGVTGEHLLGSITSLYEIFFPSGVKFGQLFQREDSHLLYYDGGLPSRWSVGLEDASLLSVVWLPMPNQPDKPSPSRSSSWDWLSEGMDKLGRHHGHAHGRHGRTVSTAELQMTAETGPRLTVTTVGGTDSVLVLLCALGLIAFDGVFGMTNADEFLEERTGLGWVSVMQMGQAAGNLSPHSSRAAKAFPRSPTAAETASQQCTPCVPG